MSQGDDKSGIGAVVVIGGGILAILVYKLAAALGADFKSTVDMLLRLLLIGGLVFGAVQIFNPTLGKLAAGIAGGVWWSIWPILDSWNREKAPMFMENFDNIWWDTWYFKYGIEVACLAVLAYLIWSDRYN